MTHDANHREIGSWRIKCSASNFELWRDQPSFRAIVTLGRIVNALTFGSYSLIPVQRDGTPAAARQRLNAFMYIGATLVEAIAFLDRSRADLLSYEHFREVMAPLIDAEDTKDLLEKRLRPLRNRAVFHFDPTFVPRTLAAEADGWFVFLTSRSLKSGEVYYDLADRSVLNSVIGVSPGHDTFEARSKDLMLRTGQLTGRFIDAANELINEALTHPDWEPEIIADDEQ